MAKVMTVNRLLLPMMGKPSVRFEPPRCAVCGSSLWCKNHHPVRRGAGTAYDKSGRELKKPTIMICKAHHLMAHENRLHFRWVGGTVEVPVVSGKFFLPQGHWEYAEFDEPIDYQTALGTGAWRRLEGGAE